jgi:hypothetical protein
MRTTPVRATGFAYMTLVLNEIHMLDGLNDTILIAAADRRISAQGKYYGTARKAFRIPYLNGALLYFGLAVFKDHSGKLRHLSDWLPAFIRNQSSTRDLRSFCLALQERLELIIPASGLGAQSSGFQICGYNQDFIPEYWLLTNIRDIDSLGRPTEFKATYKAPAPHFLKVDAKRDFHWDGVSADSCENGVKIYRFGDFRAHVVASEPIDDMFERLAQFPEDFRMPETLSDYRDYVRFKFEFIAYIYKKWARRQIIGRPIDVFAWRANARRKTILTV